MSSLSSKHCTACRADAPLVPDEQIPALMDQLPSWEVITVEGVQRLHRTFSFSNFEQALAFTNRVGVMAEEENHHPALLTEWGKVSVTWWTHKIKGLHENDFIAAAKTDALVE